MPLTVQKRVRWFAEPQRMFPLAALVLVAAIWVTALGFARIRHNDAVQTAENSNDEYIGTYEAQVVRALREIDQTLNLVKFSHDRSGHRISLAELKDKGLLLPDLLFVVSIADRNGVVVESTRPFDRGNVADQDYFLRQRENDAFYVASIPKTATGTTKLRFSRRLSGEAGSFDGIVIVSVDAGYFVSGYDAAKLGEHGMVGLLGTDGVVRIRRSGDTESTGALVDYAAAFAGTYGPDNAAPVIASEIDGVRRWTSIRELYGFPLAVVVGLSEQEQLAGARQDQRSVMWGAGASSLFVLLLTMLLWRLNWKLAEGRMRERENNAAHAERIEYLAYHDGLTGLPNRHLFSRLLGRSINEARRYKRLLAVAFLDLDRFKQINDTLGHEAGDQLLKEVAVRLKGCVRDSDTVARLGGDEFVILLPDLEAPTYAATVAQKILAVIDAPFAIIGQDFHVTASIGISTFPQDGADELVLTKNADIAMYQAKEMGKNNFQFYSEILNANSLERLTLETGLRYALERNEFRLFYQAKRDIQSGRITGMEALLRWQHPSLGMVAPVRFMNAAEDSGLIVPIGKWALRTACQQNVTWQRQGLPTLTMAVNLGEQQFTDEHLLDDVTSILRATGMAANLLELEVTESLLLHDVEDTLRILTGLKALGVRIAIDDFGRGYSSLAALQRFPLDTIKIDRSFIRAIAGASEKSGLADAIIAMGKCLSLTVVAQGVETREQADFLRTHACDELQGFYFRRPMPAEQFTQLLLVQSSEITYVGQRAGLTSG